jgi:hypothetical protein
MSRNLNLWIDTLLDMTDLSEEEKNIYEYFLNDICEHIAEQTNLFCVKQKIQEKIC